MPAPRAPATLVRTLGVDRETLRGLNPALRPTVWNGQRADTAGYVLRLPRALRSGPANRWRSAWVCRPRPAAVAPPPRSRRAARSARCSALNAAAGAHMPAAAPLPAAVESTTTHRCSHATAAASLGARTAPLRSAARQQLAAASAAENPQYYVVQAGDTLEAIAAHTRLPVKKLMALNSMHDQDDIYEGQRLRLVRGAGAGDR